MNIEIDKAVINNSNAFRDYGRTAHLTQSGKYFMIKIDKGEHRLSADKKKLYKTEHQAFKQWKFLTGKGVVLTFYLTGKQGV